MAQLPIRPITTKQRIMGAQVLVKPHGTERRIKIGAVGTVDITPNIVQVPSYTPEFGDRRLIGNFTTEKTGEINLTDCSMWTELTYEALFMGTKKYRTQSAAAAQTMTLTDIEVGYVTRVPGIRATAVSLSTTLPAVGGDPAVVVTYVEDEHFTHHPKTGFVEIVQLPDEVVEWILLSEDNKPSATLTYSLPAVTAKDKLLDIAIMETSGLRAQLEIIGVISSGPGKEVEAILPDVEFIPGGAIPMVNTEGLNTWSLKGSMYSTSSLGYGFLRGLEAI